MNTEQKQIFSKIPTPPDGAVFRLTKVDTVVLPHPFMITAKHIERSSGTLNADSAPCGMRECKLSASEHKAQTTLFIRVPSNRDLNAVPGLHDYLNSIKEAATAAGVDGFAFPDKDPWKQYAFIRQDGMGCMNDPPLYPTYTRHIALGKGGKEGGMSLRSALDDEDTEHLPDNVVAQARAMLAEWEANKPALDSPAVDAWMRDLYGHFNKCYIDDEQIAEPFEYGKPRTIIYPVPSYKLRTFHDDPRFSDEWRAKERAAIDQANAEIMARYAKVATPDNHQAVRSIRQYYPEHQPRLDWIQTAPERRGHWYSILAEQPTPETCPGERGIGKHPVNGSWCQFCGWRAEETQKTA